MRSASLGVDDGPGEKELQRALPRPDQTRQALGAAVAGDDAELDLGLAEAGVVRGDAQRAGHGQFAAAAQRKSLDACDHRLAQRLNAPEDGLAAQGEGPAFFGGSAASSRMSAPAAKARPPAPVRSTTRMAASAAQIFEGGLQFSEGGGVQRIEGFGPIERNHRQRRALLDADVGVFHAKTRVADDLSRRENFPDVTARRHESGVDCARKFTGGASVGRKVVAILGTYRKGGTLDTAVEAILEGARRKRCDTARSICPTSTSSSAPIAANAPRSQARSAAGAAKRRPGIDPCEIEAADVLVLASPVNFGNTTAIFRRFMERLIGCAYWPWEPSAPSARSRVRTLKAALVASSAAPGFMIPLSGGTRTRCALRQSCWERNRWRVCGSVLRQPQHQLSA